MKLIIQIPCLNEEKTLPITLNDLPKHIEGIDKVEWQIIDDGSSDSTVQTAKKHGVHHIVSLTKNQGLAKAFMKGIDHALDQGADIIVNTDADNQYCGADIVKLVQPILDGQSDYVIGERPILTTKHFSPIKKLLQKLGSLVVRIVSGTNVPDAPSGFRAMSKDVAIKLNVFSEYTYTIETIIQSGSLGFAVSSVPIRTNKDLRPSRLLKSMSNYIKRSIWTMIRIFMVYRPLKFFGVPGIISIMAGLTLGIRYLNFVYMGQGTGHIQSVILCGVLLSIGFFMVLIGLVADLISINRKLLEKVDYQLRKLNQIKKSQEIPLPIRKVI